MATSAEINVPVLRFPEFSGEWKYEKLSELLSSSKKRNLKLTFGKANVLSVSGELGIINQIDHLGRSYAGESVHNYHVVEEGDVVYTKSPLKDAPYGIIKCNKGKPGIVSTLYAVYKVNPEVVSGQFVDLYFSLDTRLNRYLRPLVKKGAKNDMKVNNDFVLNDKVHFPSLPEQQKIALFLTAIDAKIELLVKKKILLEQYKQGIMQQLFSQLIRFKNDEGETYPDWEEKNGNLLFASVSDKNHKSDLPILAITQEYGAIPRDLIDYEVSVTDKSVESYKVVQVGDFIISLRSFQGGIEYSTYKGICSPAYVILRPIVPIIDYFFKAYFKTERYIKELQKNLEGIRDGKMISYKYFSEIMLPFPSLSEQQKIASFLVAIDRKINAANQQLEGVKAYRRGLLQQLFV